MPDPSDVVVVPVDGYRAAVGAGAPVFSRGDGVFETLLVRDGAICLLDQHLSRLAESAALVGLAAPVESLWRSAAGAAVGRWSGGEAVLRLLLGRDAVAFAMVSAVPDRVSVAREAGVSAMTLMRPHAPLAAAKSLSYAVNSAALRQARRRGCDDVVFVDETGAVLEGPRSGVVVALTGDDGKPVLVTPDSSQVLPSTTVRALFAEAVARGIECRFRKISIADIVAAQGVWLLSSMTLATRVHTLDGVALALAPLDVVVRQLVDRAVSGGG